MLYTPIWQKNQDIFYTAAGKVYGKGFLKGLRKMAKECRGAHR